MVSIDVQGWHAEREVAIAEMLHYDALLVMGTSFSLEPRKTPDGPTTSNQRSPD